LSDHAGKLLVSFLFVPVVIGLNWRRATAPGAIAAMLGGLSVCVGWSLLSPNYPLGIDPWEIATSTSLVLFVLVSRATTPVRRDKLDVFFPAGDGEPGAGRS
jgi:Na+/proline symporter